MNAFESKRVVLTGANRGIGLALTGHLLKAGAEVWAGVRSPKDADELNILQKTFSKRLRIVQLDVTVLASISALLDLLGEQPVDFLINAAGVNLDEHREFSVLPPEVLARTFDVNAVGPFRMTQSLLPALGRAKRPVVANISSVMGSIAENESGGSIAYRMSKSAVNMLNKCLAIERTELIALTLHPGWVKTRMGGKNAQIDVDTSAKGLLDVIGNASPQDSGRYIRYSGESIAW